MNHPSIGDIVEVKLTMKVIKIDSEWSDGIRLYGITTDRNIQTGSIPISYCKVKEDN